MRPAQVEAPTVEQVRDIIKAAEEKDPTLATLIRLAALTGGRRGELCALRWSDIDFDAGTLTISRSIYRTADGGWAEKGTKTHQARPMRFDPVAVEALRGHRTTVEARASDLQLEIPQDAFVFSDSPTGSEPLHPMLVTQRAAKVAKAAGVPTHFHTLRHFHATQAIAGGFDPVTVGQRLGHANPAITLRVYAHAVEERDRDLAAAMGEQLALSKQGE